MFKFFKREGNPSVTDETTQPDVTNDGNETTHLDVVTNDDERIDDNEDLEQDVISVGFEGASSIEKQVKLCKGFIIQYNNKNMRRHVGGHIPKEKLVNVCGFCGLSGCSIGIMCGSGRSKTASQVVS